jgi:hypothetical protein
MRTWVRAAAWAGGPALTHPVCTSRSGAVVIATRYARLNSSVLEGVVGWGKEKASYETDEGMAVSSEERHVLSLAARSKTAPFHSFVPRSSRPSYDPKRRGATVQTEYRFSFGKTDISSWTFNHLLPMELRVETGEMRAHGGRAPVFAQRFITSFYTPPGHRFEPTVDSAVLQRVKILYCSRRERATETFPGKLVATAT